jgi:hypothetical protein
MNKEKIVDRVQIGTELVEIAFKRYLHSASNGQALMLSGAWGSGKSHLFKTRLISAAKAHKPNAFKVLYVSLNGLRTVDHLDRALFSAAYPLIRSGIVQATGVLIRGALKYASISLDDLLKVEASIDEKTLICLDDLERVDKTLMDAVLGKIADFLETKKAKVLVLCDERKLIENIVYSEGKEKVIGKTILFSPSPTEIGRNTITVLSTELKEALGNSSVTHDEFQQKIEASLISALKAANCSNMRLAIGATRTFIELFEGLPKNFKDHHQDILPRILRTVAATYIQLNEKPTSKMAVERVFATSEDDFYYLDSQNPNTILSNDFSNNRLESRDFPAVLAHEIFHFVAQGMCDYGLLKKQLDDVFGTNGELGKGIAPEKRLQSYRRLQQPEFDRALEDVLKNLEGSKYQTLTELNSIATTLFHLLDKGLLVRSTTSTSEVPLGVITGADLFDKVLRTADAITARAIENPDPSEILDLNWTSTPINEFHSRAIDNLKICSQKIDAQNWEKRKAALFRSLAIAPAQFSEDLLDIRQPFSRGAVFMAVQDVDAVLSQLEKMLKKSESPSDLHVIAAAFRRRYLPADMASIIQAEHDYLVRLSNGIDILAKRLPSSQTLAQSALSEIAKTINTLGG